MKISKATIPFDPFLAQQRIMDAFENHRFVVVNHGNRFGGTRVMLACGIKYFVDVLNEHRKVDDYCPARWVLLAPTDRLGKQMWREIKYLFPKDWTLHCSSADRRILTVNGGIIEVFSGEDCYDIEHYRTGVDLYTVDSANRFKELDLLETQIEVGVFSPSRGLAADRGKYMIGAGKAIYCGNPIGNPYFKKLYMKGQKDSEEYNGYWWSETFPWTDNLVNAELANQVIKTNGGEITYADRIRKMIGDRMYRMNYLAEFLSEGDI